MAFIVNNELRKQLVIDFSPISVDEEIYKIVYNNISERVGSYLSQINKETLGPILREIKIVGCKNLDNLELSISIQGVDIEKGFISAALQFPFDGCYGEKIINRLRQKIFLEEGVTRGHGIFFKVSIPPSFPIMEISSEGNGGRRRYIKG